MRSVAGIVCTKPTQKHKPLPRGAQVWETLFRNPFSKSNKLAKFIVTCI